VPRLLSFLIQNHLHIHFDGVLSRRDFVVFNRSLQSHLPGKYAHCSVDHSQVFDGIGSADRAWLRLEMLRLIHVWENCQEN
jgi:hypothetical protein